ncbi:MAG: hypothetical protein JST09_10175, partial [Bacteroidetes bacterium]|nr:hypothetical protein [Bacteroidota bacterium]
METAEYFIKKIYNLKIWLPIMPVKKKISPSRYTSPNTIRLIRGGRAYFNLLLTLIEQAKECIHLQVYIFSDDETGNLVANALKKAAARGVEVYVIA